jgi:hypothetical protein
MFQDKTKIALIGAITVTTLINFPRLLITLRESELTSQLGLTLGDVFLRSIVMFCFSWLVLSFNMVWKNKWQGQKNTKPIINGYSNKYRDSNFRSYRLNHIKANVYSWFLREWTVVFYDAVYLSLGAINSVTYLQSS